MSRFIHHGEIVYVDSLGDEHVFYPDDGRLLFLDTAVPVSAFSPDGTFEGYPYRGMVALEGAAAGMIPQVTLGVEDAVSGNFAPVARAYNGGIYLYAMSPPETDMTIPTIELRRGKA